MRIADDDRGSGSSSSVPSRPDRTRAVTDVTTSGRPEPTWAAAQPDRVTVGYAADIIVTPALRAMRRAHPHVEVGALHLAWNEPHPALTDHRVDAVVARLPFRTEALAVTPLYDETRLVMLPLDHPLAGKAAITLDDIAHEPLPRVGDPAFDAFWRVDPRPDGRRAPDGPLVDSFEDKLELIAGGQALLTAPEA